MNKADKKTLTQVDAVSMIVGVVIGTGIFLTPAAVASACSSVGGLLAIWILGGVISIAGALCYAEMATSFPDRGGDYHYLHVGLGADIAFMFGWARMTIIQTGTIASLAYAFGDYTNQLFPAGEFGPTLFAAAAIVLLTSAHAIGLREGTRTQNTLSGIKLAGLALIIISGFVGISSDGTPPPPAQSGGIPLGLALVFVMYTYGGWNEAAYLAGEMKNLRRDFIRSVIGAVALIILIYLAVNVACLARLGLGGMQSSQLIAADLMRSAWGPWGGTFISVLIACSALGACSSAIFTGSRTNFALGRDHRTFRFMGKWHEANHTPLRGLLVQAVIGLGLISLGGLTREGFVTMVEYTAPGFWLFLLLSGVALFRLRGRTPEAPNPFRVPGFPYVPLVFCLASGYMFYSSVLYAITLEGLGARVGILVLLAGLPILGVERFTRRTGRRTGRRIDT